MKIFFCDNDINNLYNFRGNILRAVTDSGHDIALIVPDDKAKRENEKHRIITVPMSPSGTNPIKDASYYKDLKKLYAAEKPDLVINYTIKPNIYSAWAASSLGIPVIDVVAGLGYVFADNSFTKRMARKLYKTGLSKAHKVFVLNEENKTKLTKNSFVDREKIMLLPGGEGVDLKKFTFLPKRFEHTRFLMIARVLYDKGYSEFVEAAKLVKKRFPEVIFSLVGPVDDSSPMRVPFKVIANDVNAGVIEYLGVTSRILDYLHDPDTAVVIPSKYPEGLNRSLMEACATGCPIITTDIPGCRETVMEKINGYLVPPRNAEALAEACIKFIDLPRESKIEMGRQSRIIAEESFDINRVIDVYLSSINDISGK